VYIIPETTCLDAFKTRTLLGALGSLERREMADTAKSDN
jgi:hypothetical protein